MHTAQCSIWTNRDMQKWKSNIYFTETSMTTYKSRISHWNTQWCTKYSSYVLSLINDLYSVLSLSLSLFLGGEQANQCVAFMLTYTRSVNVLQNYLIMTEFKYIFIHDLLSENGRFYSIYSAYTIDSIGWCEKIPTYYKVKKPSIFHLKQSCI